MEVPAVGYHRGRGRGARGARGARGGRGRGGGGPGPGIINDLYIPVYSNTINALHQQMIN